MFLYYLILSIKFLITSLVSFLALEVQVAPSVPEPERKLRDTIKNLVGEKEHY